MPTKIGGHIGHQFISHTGVHVCVWCGLCMCFVYMCGLFVRSYMCCVIVLYSVYVVYVVCVSELCVCVCVCVFTSVCICMNSTVTYVYTFSSHLLIPVCK